VGQFDQTARPLAKMDGSACFGWALSCCEPVPRLSFLGWDDTRRLVCPGEPERTNDLVATFRDEDRPKRQVWMIAEVEEEPEKGALYRMGQYEILLGKEVNPDGDPDGPAVGSLLINLTGEQRFKCVDWAWAGGAFGTRLAPFVVDVANQDAILTLDRIEKKELGLPVLPLLALMRGGGTPAFIERWKQVVETEADESRRVQYREAAIVFAELTRCQVNWLQATEGWMMRESQYIKSWERVGEERAELRTQRASLLRLIRVRVQDPVPDAIKLAIEGTNDLSKLESWFDAAALVGSIAELRKEMKIEP
jgi:hypothetical protein